MVDETLLLVTSHEGCRERELVNARKGGESISLQRVGNITCH